VSYPTGHRSNGDTDTESDVSAAESHRCSHRNTPPVSDTELRSSLRQCPERVHLVRERIVRGGGQDSHVTTPRSRLPDSYAVVSDGGEPRFTSRETDSGLLVIADLRGVPRDDSETEVDLTDDSLILTVGKRYVWRVPVADDRPSISGVSLNNDILEARVDVGD